MFLLIICVKFIHLMLVIHFKIYMTLKADIFEYVSRRVFLLVDLI
jgi:hypothetical protein